MLELGPDERRFHERDRRRRPTRPDVDVLVTVGPLAAAMTDRFDGEVLSGGRRRARPRRCCPSCWRPATWCSSRPRAASGSKSCAVHSRRRRVSAAACCPSPRDHRLDLGTRPDRRHRVAADQPVPQPRSSSSSCASGRSARTSARRGREGHQIKAGTPTMGGIIIFAAVAVPFVILSTRRLAVDGRVRRGGGVRAARVRRRLHEDRHAAARWACARAPSSWSRSRSRSGCGGSRPRRRASTPPSSLRPVDVSIDLGPLYPLFIYLVVAGTTSAVNLTDGLDGLAAGCAAIVLLAYVGITFITSGEHRPDVARGLPGRRVHRLSVVQQLPGEHLHGRHGLARVRRRDRGPGDHDQHRGAADPARRDLRDRGAVGA